ncbi:MAG: XRE family transcriptional regulator [Ostreibacterium sp.]
MKLGERLEQLRKSAGMSRDSVIDSEKTTISKSTLQAWELGNREPSLSGIIELANLYETDAKSIIFDDEKTEVEAGSEYQQVPFYKAEASAGHGSFLNERREPSHYLAFRKRWFAARGFAKKDLIGLVAHGDSMEPTIQNGAAIIIDTSKVEAMDGNIYVIRINDRLWVKRAEWLPSGGLRLISDNTFYETMNVTRKDMQSDDIEVIGQVVHTAYDLIR